MNVRRAASVMAVLSVMATVTSPASAESRAINIKDNYFATRYLVITIGDAVTWSNTGEVGHTVTAFDGSYSSSNSETCDDANPLTQEDCLEPGETFSRSFETAGTYDYYCKIHGNAEVQPDPDVSATDQPCGMCARIKVNKKSSPTQEPTRSINPTPKRTRTTSPSPSPSKSVSGSPTATTTLSPVAAGAPGGSRGGRGLLALLVIVGLGGAGVGVWRRYLAPR